MKTFLSLSFLLLPNFFLSAQDNPALETTADEVVVTGTRLARPADQSPQRITVIDSATIARAGDLGQLLNEQAGIHINGIYSNPGKDRSVFLRNAANAFTLILVDGQPLLDPSSLGGAVDLRLLDLAGVERIEVLRGGTSVLYGSDAVAGVVNLITRKDSAPSSPTVHLRAAAQSYNTLETGASFRGALRRLSYNGSVSYFNTDGISEAKQPQDATTDFDKDGASRFNANLVLNYRPNEKWSIRPTLRVARFEGDFDDGSFQDGDNSYTNDMIAPSLAVDYKKNDWTYSGRYSFVATDRLFNSAFGEFPFLGRMHQADAFGVFDKDKSGSLTLGAQLRHEGLDPQADDLLTVTTISPYLQYALNTPGGLLLDLGARYSQHSEFGGQLNGSVGLGVQTTATLSTRLNISTAFQSPTLDQLAGPFGANPDLQPQTSVSLELATRFTDPDGSYQFSLAVFRREVKDLIVYNEDFNYENLDELVDNGVEIEGYFGLSNAFRFNGNVTLLKGKLTSRDGTETEDFPRRPPLTGTLGITFDPKSPFLARLSGVYTGERPDVFFDADFTRFDVNLAPYFLVNVYAECKLMKQRNLTLFTEIRNLTNADFVEVSGFSTQGTTLRAGVAIQL